MVIGFRLLAYYLDLNTCCSAKEAFASSQGEGVDSMNMSPPSAVQERSSWSMFRTWLQDWSELAKARLSLLVLLTTLVGLYCGSAGRMELWRTLFTLLGTSLVAAAITDCP